MGWRLCLAGDWTGAEREAELAKLRGEGYGSCPCHKPDPWCPGQPGREEALAQMATNLTPAQEVNDPEIMEV